MSFGEHKVTHLFTSYDKSSNLERGTPIAPHLHTVFSLCNHSGRNGGHAGEQECPPPFRVSDFPIDPTTTSITTISHRVDSVQWLIMPGTPLAPRLGKEWAAFCAERLHNIVVVHLLPTSAVGWCGHHLAIAFAEPSWCQYIVIKASLLHTHFFFFIVCT